MFRESFDLWRSLPLQDFCPLPLGSHTPPGALAKSCLCSLGGLVSLGTLFGEYSPIAWPRAPAICVGLPVSHTRGAGSLTVSIAQVALRLGLFLSARQRTKRFYRGGPGLGSPVSCASGKLETK